MRGVAYSSKLQCAFNGWRVLEEGEIALDLPLGDLCSMDAAIKIAEGIMPSVWRISVCNEGKAIVEYRLSLGKWTAYDES